ncbi:MAG: hypothetical protein KBD64_00940 [Gammaproteobacteria bacterium]|nr:hypothetical protein [Gammaproteobacteria bacterium]
MPIIDECTTAPVDLAEQKRAFHEHLARHFVIINTTPAEGKIKPLAKLSQFLEIYSDAVDDACLLTIIDKLSVTDQAIFMRELNPDFISTKLVTQDAFLALVALLSPIDALVFLLCRCTVPASLTLNLDTIFALENVNTIVPEIYHEQLRSMIQSCIDARSIDVAEPLDPNVSYDFTVKELQKIHQQCEKYFNLNYANNLAKILHILDLLSNDLELDDSDGGTVIVDPDSKIDPDTKDSKISKIAFLNNLSYPDLEQINSILELILIMKLLPVQVLASATEALVRIVPSSIKDTITSSFEGKMNLIASIDSEVRLEVLENLHATGFPTSPEQLIQLLRLLPAKDWNKIPSIFYGCFWNINSDIHIFKHILFNVIRSVSISPTTASETWTEFETDHSVKKVFYGMREYFSAVGLETLKVLLDSPKGRRELFNGCDLETAIELTQALDEIVDSSWNFWQIHQTKDELNNTLELLACDKAKFIQQLDLYAIAVLTNSFTELLTLFTEFTLVNSDNLEKFVRLLIYDGKMSFFLQDSATRLIALNSALPEKAKEIFETCFPKGFFAKILHPEASPFSIGQLPIRAKTPEEAIMRLLKSKTPCLESIKSDLLDAPHTMRPIRAIPKDEEFDIVEKSYCDLALSPTATTAVPTTLYETLHQRLAELTFSDLQAVSRVTRDAVITHRGVISSGLVAATKVVIDFRNPVLGPIVRIAEGYAIPYMRPLVRRTLAHAMRALPVVQQVASAAACATASAAVSTASAAASAAASAVRSAVGSAAGRSKL